MDPRMIEMDLVQANANLQYAENAYKQAKVFYDKGELTDSVFNRVCQLAVQADMALCEAMVIASKNGYKADQIERVIANA